MSSISGLSPVSMFILDQKDEVTSATQWVKTDVSTLSNVEKFKAEAGSITSADDLMGNYRALSVVLGAYGLSSLQNSTALVKDLLTQNPSSSSSVAARSSNVSWLTFARAFSDWNSSSSDGSQPFDTTDKIDAVVQKYEMNQYENSLNTDNSGVGNALYFARTMTASTSLAQVMSDSKLLKVVETVSGYDPTTFGALDYDQQVRLLQKTFKSSDFSSPEKIQHYAERYLGMLQISPQTTTSPATLLTLYGSDGSGDPILSLFGATSSNLSSLF
ncbi:MAG: DUF1217 domain-containing protein [Acetobacter sp.]|jgi:hypothetical protein|nr:DUF1217 domain-containing protein [Acetobacter sp.]